MISAGGRRAAVMLTLGVVLLLTIPPTTAAAESAPLISQSFESGAGLPAGWRLVEYRPGQSSATLVGEPDGHFLRITSPAPNHARVLFPVTPAAGTTYRFRARARAGRVGDGAAAVLGVDGQYTVSESVRTADRWQELDLYVESGPAGPVELSVGLGHFGQLNSGVADFDDVTVTPVDSVPAGTQVTRLAPPGPAASAGTTAAGGSPATATTAPRTAAQVPATRGPSPLLAVFAGVLAAVAVGVVVVLRRQRSGREDPRDP